MLNELFRSRIEATIVLNAGFVENMANALKFVYYLALETNYF